LFLFLGKISLSEPFCELDSLNAMEKTTLKEKVAKIKEETKMLDSGAEISDQFRRILLGFADCFSSDASPKKLNANQKEAFKNCILQKVVEMVEDEVD